MVELHLLDASFILGFFFLMKYIQVFDWDLMSHFTLHAEIETRGFCLTSY